MDLFKGKQPPERHGGSGRSQPPGRYRSGGSDEIIKEKNYFFLMKDELPYINLDKYPADKKYYGKIYLIVTALQELFIGSGQVESSSKKLYDAFTYSKRDPEKKTLTIPGSSFKGTILTNLSMFLNQSFIPQDSPRPFRTQDRP